MKWDSGEKALYDAVYHLMLAGNKQYEIVWERNNLWLYSLISVYECPSL